MSFLHASGAGAVARFGATIWAGYVAVAIVGYYTGFWRFERHHLESAWLVLSLLAGAALALRSVEASSIDLQEDQASAAAPSAWLLLGAGLIAAFVLYGGALTLGLFSDDFVLLPRAREGASAPAHAEFFRPVPIWLWWAIARATPIPDVWLHVVNVVLHGVNGMLVCLLARQWGLDRAWVMAAGALFLTFPASVEAVAWPSGIQDVLMTTTGLLAVWLANRDRVSVVGRVFMVGLVLVALLTKETAVAFAVLGVVVFASRTWQVRRRLSTDGERASTLRQAVVALIVVAVVTASYAIWRIATAEGPMSNLPEVSRLAMKDFVVRPFAALGSPWSAADLASWPLAGVLTGCLVVGLLIAQLWGRRTASSSPIVSPLLWVFIASAPVGGYFFVGPDLDGSRYLYLPSVGWAVWLAALCQSTSHVQIRRRPLAWACVALLTLLIVVQIGGVRAHVAAWRDAAVARERLLADVASTAERERCEAVAVDAAPDVVNGVYVFRNGLAEALHARRVTARLAAAADVTERCRIAWKPAQR